MTPEGEEKTPGGKVVQEIVWRAVEEIAKAIDQARMEALEEAAVRLERLIENCGESPYNCATCAAFRDGAAAIRALK